MQPFTGLISTAAYLPDRNIDTDVIYPGRFLTVISSKDLGRFAFHDRRFDADGAPRADFVLNQPAWRDAAILVAGHNFGCGSSREHAVWSLLDIGIRCVMATGFGEIFQGNCYRNGVLPVTVTDELHALLADDALAARQLIVDLLKREIRRSDGSAFAFDIADLRRDALLNGWDEIDLIMNLDGARITDFEARQREQQPWLYAGE